jgi:type II secretory pathway component GspD/PulD (secretin)
MELAPLVTGAPTFEEFSWEVTREEQQEQEGDETTTETSTRTIQLPLQLAESLEVTVCVPDRGILLIGGLTSQDLEDKERGVPVLSKIPIMKRLFTAEGQSNDRNTLLILVRPRIILMNEEENRAF